MAATVITGGLCLLCPRTTDLGSMLCPRCSNELWLALRRLTETYAIVATSTSLRLPGTSSGTGRATPGYGSRSPANDDVIILTDPRTTLDESLRARSVPAVLSQWVRQVAEETGALPPGPATVAADVNYLAGQWGWIARQPWVDEFATEIRELTQAVIAALRLEHRPVPIGPCPTKVLAAGRIRPCGRTLHVRPAASRIRCSACDTVWPRHRWGELGQALGDPRSDYAQLATWLNIPTGTLRRWRAQDRWTPDPARGRGRETWLRAEALASWTRRHGTDPGEPPDSAVT
ncbi:MULTISPECIES: hypothetical protein [unclassified Crossiella]|uniref:zinc finger domain-containing protein n=1 Tax=unclassified Crossiella TaxID=2620835 RepID=UPI001FFF5FD1|nr:MULTISPECIES: hypothetical protein [unclassified Crossiella]MCK2242160.1 hypothetical protein [Crossiella sp. S99.2]MCK2256063.1 hypothetical protein [Crossiella sp. S99.1]